MFKLKTKKKSSWFRVKKVIKKANVVLEVLDSRDPIGTKSLELERLIKGLHKKLLLVLNKVDLVPSYVIDKWIIRLETDGYHVFSGSAKKKGDMMILARISKRLAGKKKAVIAVIGYPNVGKSTIINSLKGSHVVETSPIPGFTKGEKLVRVDEDLLIVDTPGILPSRKLNEYEMVRRGVIPPEKLQDPLSSSIKFLNVILNLMPHLLYDTYGISEKDPHRFLELLSIKRGFLLKGGMPDIDEAARTILRDWQKGKLKFYLLPKSE